ncbi:hypothetical protein [Burkholderia alba]|uniref:hypothetical protein n=1 Tax=Burkholderia alba TaxID=2683677 RepID=UPI002B061DDB|nr:hypothetical protein [Burkholderia alba]
MLSHHELAALLLLKDMPRPAHLLDDDLAALARYRLVALDQRDGDASVLHLTHRGRALLDCLLDDARRV